MRNRKRILEAAGEVIAERGLKARLDEIARHAEVGVGTVYRHFGDREGLVRALFDDQFDEIVAIVERALELDDPWAGFEYVMEQMVGVHARSRGVRELLFGSGAGEGESLLSQGRDRLEPLLAELVRRAQADGSLRPDVSNEDLPLLQIMVGAVADYARGIDAQVHRRLLTIVLDGLRTRRDAPSPLPTQAVDRDQALSFLARGTTPRG